MQVGSKRVNVKKMAWLVGKNENATDVVDYVVFLNFLLNADDKNVAQVTPEHIARSTRMKLADQQVNDAIQKLTALSALEKLDGNSYKINPDYIK